MSRKLHPVRKSLAKARRRAAPLRLEALEDRVVPDVRPITEVGNNVANPTWGVSNTDLLRLSPVAYADGISSPSRPNTLSPREISNNLNNQSDPIFSFADNLGPAQSKSLSDFAYVWGQFIDHDMDLTPTSSGESFNIPADPTRPNDAMGVEAFIRSTFDPNTGTSNPRQQVNADTSFLDLSQVYGSTQVVANALRVVGPNGSLGARLKISPGGLLPYDNTTYFNPAQIQALNMANDAQQVAEPDLFAAGDVRANENIELTAMQTLFVRNHNRLVDALSTMSPAAFGFSSWTDENLYQEARKLNIATEEMITYNDFLPAILGPNALTPYNGYNPSVNASIATEFSTVAFRFGHSLLSNGVGRVSNDGTAINDVNPNGPTVNLAEDFFRPDLITPNGTVAPLVDRNGNPDPHTSSNIGAILKADASNAANEMDLPAIDEVRSLLFGIPNAPGTDLIARDIQRARDDGIGTYNQLRVAFGLAPVTSYAQISSDPNVQAEFVATYGPDTPADANKIDPLEGMFAEDHVPGGDVGPTIRAVLANQFERLRDGDRFLYLNEQFTPAEQALLGQAHTLAQVIQHNTDITNLQSNVFYFKESIEGTVYFDPDGNGTREAGEPGVRGVTVNLLDHSGAVVASAVTDVNGHYSFTDQTGIPGTGNFTLQVVIPPGLTQNATEKSHNPGVIHMSRGGLDLDGENFALLLAPGGAAPSFAGGSGSTGGLVPGAPTGTGGTGTLSGTGGASAPLEAVPPGGASTGGSVVTLSAPSGALPGSANTVTVSTPDAVSSLVTSPLVVQPSGADSGLALLGVADAGASTPSDPLALPAAPLDAPGVTVL